MVAPRFALVLLAAILTLPVIGCGTRFMKGSDEPMSEPPAGMALVVFHRPSAWDWDDDCPIYDGTRLIGNLRGEQWFQYPCEPGRHHFIGRAQKVSVIEATLAAGRTYDLVLDVGLGVWKADVVLQPLARDDKRRKKLERWERSDDFLVWRGDTREALAYEERTLRANERALEDFTRGDKRDRLLVLRADDCR